MKATRQRGDVMMVVRMSAAARMGRKRKGYSFGYVRQVLNEERSNTDIEMLWKQLVDLRTPKPRRSK